MSERPGFQVVGHTEKRMIRLLAIAVTGLAILMLPLAIFGLWVPLPGSIAVPICIASLIAGVWVGFRLSSKESPGRIELLEAKELAEVEEYKALRSFEVEEFEDEGLHFFLELDNGDVLFLCGQYLYDHQETDDVEEPQKPSFPCAEFRIRRHREKHWVYDVEPLSPYIPPEEILPQYSDTYIKKHGFPVDGAIYLQAYDELKAAIRG